MIPGPNEQIQFCLKETKKHLKITVKERLIQNDSIRHLELLS